MKICTGIAGALSLNRSKDVEAFGVSAFDIEARLHVHEINTFHRRESQENIISDVLTGDSAEETTMYQPNLCARVKLIFCGEAGARSRPSRPHVSQASRCFPFPLVGDTHRTDTVSFA